MSLKQVLVLIAVAHLACACPPGALVPLFRYYSGGTTCDHFYTTNFYELGCGAIGYSFERAECYVPCSQVQNSVPLRRWFHGNDHFYSISEFPAGWTYEGNEGYCFPNQVDGTIPLYRYYKGSGCYDHLYTTDANEIGTTTPGETGNHGYNFERVECYVYPTA